MLEQLPPKEGPEPLGSNSIAPTTKAHPAPACVWEAWPRPRGGAGEAPRCLLFCFSHSPPLLTALWVPPAGLPREAPRRLPPPLAPPGAQNPVPTTRPAVPRSWPSPRPRPVPTTCSPAARRRSRKQEGAHGAGRKRRKRRGLICGRSRTPGRSPCAGRAGARGAASRGGPWVPRPCQPQAQLSHWTMEEESLNQAADSQPKETSPARRCPGASVQPRGALPHSTRPDAAFPPKQGLLPQQMPAPCGSGDNWKVDGYLFLCLQSWVFS